MLGQRRTVLSLAVLGLLTLPLGGCGGSQTTTVTVPPPAVAQVTSATATASAVARVAPPDPVVRFALTTTSPEGTWPFTAQLGSITTNPNGFTGSDPIPPQDTYLMVQVNVVSQITGRMVPPPRLIVVCHGPHDDRWQLAPPGSIGYDQGSESAPDTEGFYVSTGDGQPHAWDTEWQVPEGTSTTGVKCILEDGGRGDGTIRVVGSGRLN
jgi:hypothetical protein